MATCTHPRRFPPSMEVPGTVIQRTFHHLTKPKRTKQTTPNKVTMSRHNISHSTMIDAPIERVWAALLDTDGWGEWNKWTKLVVASTPPTSRQRGKLEACYEGDGKKWVTFDFNFGEISEEKHLLAWEGSVAGGLLFSGRHSMRLESDGQQRTRLVHQERFGGVLPMLGLGLPYKKLNRNYKYMNEALKEFVEQPTVATLG